MRTKRIFKNILLGSMFVAAMFSTAYAADYNIRDYSSSITPNGNLVVVDYFSAGTNTTHSKTVDLGGINDVYVSFHIPTNGVTIGTATFSVTQSMDETTYSALTASEMIMTTNTLYTSNVYGTNTTDTFSGFYRGTNTSTFVGELGTGTVAANQYYHLMPYGSTLKFNCDLGETGTDTVKFKIILRKGGSINKF